MAKIGNVVDAETAMRIVRGLRMSPGLDPKNLLRPVIWPEDKAKQANGTDIQKGSLTNQSFPCTRSLVHLICEKDVILATFAKAGSVSRFYSIEVMQFDCPYDAGQNGPYKVSVWNHFLFVDCKPDEWARGRVVRMTHYDEAEVFTFDKAIEDEDASYMLSLAIHLEHFAFSPLASTKLKPTRRSLNNPLDYPRQFEPLEIVNLRLPEKIDHPESTGRSINLRFPVIEHLRRIRDKKTGEEKLITVREHWRGPEGAPVKPKTEKVYKVTR